MNTPAEPKLPADRASARALLEAEVMLDAAPAPHVRAAILRAAAEHARATRDTPAHEARPGRGARNWRLWLAWQPALPAGIAVAVGILAVALSVRQRVWSGHHDSVASPPLRFV